MSKADDILNDELHPGDPGQTPRGGEHGRIKPTPAGGGCLRVLEAAGFGGIVVATLAAALVGRWRR